MTSYSIDFEIIDINDLWVVVQNQESDPTLSDIDFKNEMDLIWTNLKGSSDLSHFIFEINVGESRIRHRTTLEVNF